MNRSTILFSALIILCLSLVGCATMSDVLKSKDQGSIELYSVSFDQAWEIAVTVLRWEDCETIEEHRSSGYMLTTVGQNFVSAGSLVGVWIEPANNGQSKVTIVTKRKVQTNLATGLTESTFHIRFKQAVEILKSGKTLPFDPPTQY